jgi:hypothetical protein
LGPGSSMDPDECRTPRGQIGESVLLPPPMKLLSAREMKAVEGPSAPAENFEDDEGVVPPPPLPFFAGVERASERASREPPIIVSVGSVGHPHDCGPPCKYARRKGGCQHGRFCKECHQCQWARDCSTAVPALVVNTFSAGSVGHPELCGQPCKYMRRKSGCRNGEQCPDCHVCQWKRRAQPDKEEQDTNKFLDEEGAAPGGAGVEPDVQLLRLHDELSKEAVADPWPSIGSHGHPHTCVGMGCKYNDKARGCKDGKLCLRCHLCRWTRYAKPAGTAETPGQLFDGIWTCQSLAV